MGGGCAPGAIALAAGSVWAAGSAVGPGTKSAFFSTGFLLTVFALSHARNVPFSSTPAVGFLVAALVAAFAVVLAAGFAAADFAVVLD